MFPAITGQKSHGMDEEVCVLRSHVLTKAFLYSLSPHCVMGLSAEPELNHDTSTQSLGKCLPVFLLNPSKHLFRGRQLVKLHSCKPIKERFGLKNSLNCSHCTQPILLKHLAWGGQ